MKRLFLFLSAIFFTALSFVLPVIYPLKPAGLRITAAADTAAEYGLIGENVILYNFEMQPVTSLPPTYFVIITGESESYYSVTYNDLSGYVEKLRIFKIDYEPKLKFGIAYFTAQNDTHSVIIRSAPVSNAQQVSAIPDGEKAFYYGTLTGEALIPAAGNVWYYVKYSDGGTKFGYVYSAQGSAESFAVNPGDKVVAPTEPGGAQTPDEDGFPDWAFILLLCIPAVIIMLALFSRGGRRTQNS